MFYQHPVSRALMEQIEAEVQQVVKRLVEEALEQTGINISRDSTDSQGIVSNAPSGFAWERQVSHSIEQPIEQIRELFPM